MHLVSRILPPTLPMSSDEAFPGNILCVCLPLGYHCKLVSQIFCIILLHSSLQEKALTSFLSRWHSPWMSLWQPLGHPHQCSKLPTRTPGSHHTGLPVITCGCSLCFSHLLFLLRRTIPNIHISDTCRQAAGHDESEQMHQCIGSVGRLEMGLLRC